MRVFSSHYSAAAEHHFVLSQSPGLVWEDVLDLPQVLCDIKSTTLDPRVLLLIIQVQVLSDEEHLANLHQLDGQVEWNWDHHLDREVILIICYVTV